MYSRGSDSLRLTRGGQFKLEEIVESVLIVMIIILVAMFVIANSITSLSAVIFHHFASRSGNYGRFIRNSLEGGFTYNFCQIYIGPLPSISFFFSY